MKLLSVQYLRGLAAFLVLVAHSFEHPMIVDSEYVVRIGRLGVIVFFAISGFIIVLIAGQEFNPIRFFQRRLLRIVPLYWLMTFGVAAIAVFAPTLLKSTAFSFPHLIQSMLFIPHWAPQVPQIPEVGNVPLLKLGWTLNYEMFFYLFFALFAFLRATQRVIALTLVFGVFTTIGMLYPVPGPALNFYASARVMVFCIGCWIGLFTLNGGVIRQSWQLIALGIFAVAALFFGFVHDPATKGGDLVIAAFGLGSGALLLVMIGLEKVLPKVRFLELLGDASYSLYLVHIYWIGLVVAVGHRFFGLDAPLLLLVAAGVAGGLAAGLALHIFVEKPLLRALQRPARRKPVTPAGSPIDLPRDGVPPSLH